MALLLAAADVEPEVLFALALVALILFVIALVQTTLSNIVAWGGVAISLAGVLAWWP